MILVQAALLAVPTSLLLLAGLMPSVIADRCVHRFRRLVLMLASLHAVAAFASAVWVANMGGWHWALFGGEAGAVPTGVSLYYDGVAALMLMMVSFVGFVVCKYSIRYLDGEATQGRYFRWIALTIGAVSLMVVAGNLLLFFLAWVTTSFGLHRLLLHYPQRGAAQRAAWTKFTISRIGDLFLVFAFVLSYRSFGTLELTEIFAAVGGSAASGTASAGALSAIAWLLMLGAVTKSAQFPFHTWLPQTMETPTPVSALMHAGIVNAGGYLVIRMSPVVSQTPGVLTTLAVIGAVTACFAGVVMLTQTSVKRALAYSTIAQMGFMMLQCGLGAFSAAMLHLLAHSLYKAHAFLGSGGVVHQAQATRGVKLAMPESIRSLTLLALAAVFTLGCYGGVTLGLGLDPGAKAGGYALAFVLCLALTTWSWRIISATTRRTAVVGLPVVLMLSLVYVASYLGGGLRDCRVKFSSHEISLDRKDETP